MLIVEKTAAGGGNCRHSGGFLFDVDGPKAVDHLDALCFGKTDRTVLEAYAGGLHEVPGWIESLGGTAAPVDSAAFGGMLPSWPHFPGSGHVSYRQFEPDRDERPGVALWRLLEAGRSSARHPVSAQQPGCGTADRARATWTGAIVEQDGGPRGCGAQRSDPRQRSFEPTPELRDTYLPLPLVSVGHPATPATRSVWRTRPAPRSGT